MRQFINLITALVVVFSCAARSQGATIMFSIFLDGVQETPANASPGTGTGSLSLDDATGDYTTAGTFSALIFTTTLAHIHGPAAIGDGPAGIIDPLTVDIGVTSGTFSGAGTFSAAEMADLLGNLYYVNIHTTSFPGGEIRGQILKIPEPASVVLLGCGALVVVAAAWRRRRSR